jgi:hypothetical protein
LGPGEFQALEGSFAESFGGGDFAESGGVFEACAGESGCGVDPAAFFEPAEEGVAVCGGFGFEFCPEIPGALQDGVVAGLPR